MSCKRVCPLLVAAALAALAAGPASAADPGRWTETGHHAIPLYYYQGMASDPARNLFFNGHVGLYRTDPELRETARRDDVIPPGVHLTERYNHIGDIAWDAREGGRVLLPLECYYPPSKDFCGHGSIGVADPRTLQWRYYVKLDERDIGKVMWITLSPDGSLLWTQFRDDLLAFRTDSINPSNAAPGGAKPRPVRRLRGAVPPPGISGAHFYRGRLYTAGQEGELFQVWSTDVRDGSQRLEIERKIVGETEGLDIVRVLGGVLHWMILPYNDERYPTYGASSGTVLSFVPRFGPDRSFGLPRILIGRTRGMRRARRGRPFRLRVRATGGRVRRVRVALRDARGRRIGRSRRFNLGSRGRRVRIRVRRRLRRGRYRLVASGRALDGRPVRAVKRKRLRRR